ncbi:hypothetical protein A3J78_02185 [Candidatus Beckwithbacteria bacterium RBG_13_35_6]|uniref:Uncharacterized protein n=1 Tax=Candidatus Beckwithbacteria bacterium RBG_13_35_6 TaxID=1797456 RepID=A0A1F5DHG7_9BACT|nr:MAG: hypothetical protein A3J78_02185 [Candidatus Beckwithbacteria bacterium RBG_13_35_6]
MQPETEQLLQKWLKLQILQYKLSFIKTLVMLLLFLTGIWFVYFNLLPKLETQLQKTQSLLEQMSNVSSGVQEKESLLEEIQKQFKNLP